MSPVKIVGLEEHFVIPGLLEAWGKLPPDRRDLAFRPAAEADTWRRLLELGPERIAAMDATGLSVQVLSLTTPGVQNLPARQAVALAPGGQRLARGGRHGTTGSLPGAGGAADQRRARPRRSSSAPSPASARWSDALRPHWPAAPGPRRPVASL
jgi:hypothetical protein